MRKIFIILLLSFLCACNKKNASIIDSFKITQPITHKVFDLQNGSKDLLDPNSIAVSGNNITVWNLRAQSLFTTINIETKRVIKHWGTKGQGPNEFLGLIDMYNNYSESGLNIWDGFLGKLYFFPHNILESDSISFQTIPIGITNLSDEIRNYYSYSVMQIDSSLFFIQGGNNNKRFTLIDRKSNEIKEIGDYPPEDINTQLPVVMRNIAYNGRIRYNSSLKKLVYMAFDSEMFEIYDVNGANVKLAMGNYTTVPKYTRNGSSTVLVESVANGKGRNRMVTVSAENIFILYQDYKKAGMLKQTDYSLVSNMVLVYDWNGKPVKIYELDCFVSDFDYDKTRNRLWATHYNEDTFDPEIIYFEL